jgi:hypothetical protein
MEKCIDCNKEYKLTLQRVPVVVGVGDRPDLLPLLPIFAAGVAVRVLIDGTAHGKSITFLWHWQLTDY